MPFKKKSKKNTIFISILPTVLSQIKPFSFSYLFIITITITITITIIYSYFSSPFSRYAKCLQVCHFIRTLNPSNITAKDLSIRCYLEIGCLAEAYEELSAGVDSVDELYLLGNIYTKMGKLSL